MEVLVFLGAKNYKSMFRVRRALAPGTSLSLEVTLLAACLEEINDLKVSLCNDCDSIYRDRSIAELP